MLLGINPLLTGRLLLRLDEMGHSDSVAAADAHVPDRRVQDELIDAAGVGESGVQFIDRFAYYTLVTEAALVIRTGETRKCGNAVFRKGPVLTVDNGEAGAAPGTREGR